MTTSDFLLIAPEVADALAEQRPVVALESTIISHGMPHPRNVATALAVEDAVRQQGAVPATVALLEGRLVVGLTADQIEQLGSAPDVAKVSWRDVGATLANKTLGATTVATTMFAAHQAGIRLFATGGLGGVHRGDTGDVSADLTALGSLPVAVVSAGVKAVLDLPRTLEALETLGVPVLGWQTEVFPEFWTRGLDLPVTASVSDVSHAAAILHAHWSVGLTTGVVLATPVPAEYEADQVIIEAAIEAGLAAAHDQGVSGAEITPFLLAHIVETTGGASLDTNVALVTHNATVAAQVAVALAGYEA